ncbi:MAG: DNA adenine methylase [Thermoplasmataceae archaeon]
MPYLRLMKYPGAKFTIIPVIEDIFRSSNCEVFVDAFGGSGSVLLNIPSKMPVYNDINSDLVAVFSTIKHHTFEFKSALKREVSDILNTSGKWVNSKRGAVSKRDMNAIEKAVNYVVSFSTSFGGMGRTYSTGKEKAYKAYLKRTLEIYDNISKNVSGWTIHNMDFRELISKYDKTGTFFFFDPPYPGKIWYDYDFRETDFADLAERIKTLRGKYLLTLNSEDEPLFDIFGNPTFIRSYENENGKKRPDSKKYRYKAFYTNVKR